MRGALPAEHAQDDREATTVPLSSQSIHPGHPPTQGCTSHATSRPVCAQSSSRGTPASSRLHAAVLNGVPFQLWRSEKPACCCAADDLAGCPYGELEAVRSSSTQSWLLYVVDVVLQQQHIRGHIRSTRSALRQSHDQPVILQNDLHLQMSNFDNTRASRTGPIWNEVESAGHHVHIRISKCLFGATPGCRC